MLTKRVSRIGQTHETSHGYCSYSWDWVHWVRAPRQEMECVAPHRAYDVCRQRNLREFETLPTGRQPVIGFVSLFNPGLSPRAVRQLGRLTGGLAGLRNRRLTARG
jgi:hypothetical protein